MPVAVTRQHIDETHPLGGRESGLLVCDIALVVGLMHASTLLQGVLPMQRGVSWDGHLSGALAALVTARMLREETAGAAARGPRA